MRQIVRFILFAAALAGFTPANAGPETQGEWQLVKPLPFFPIHLHVLATGNATGKVMFWGLVGQRDDPRLWDPANPNQDVRSLPNPGFNTFCTGHTHLPDGRLFVAGGTLVQDGEGLPKASAFNPVTETWSGFPDMNAGRWYPTTTVLGNGDVLVVSGSVDNTFGVNKLPQVLQFGSNSWRDLTSAVLAQDLYPAMILAPNGKVFNPGPDSRTRYLDTSGTGAWSDVANRSGGYRDYGSAVMYAPGKILVMGGGDPPKNTAEVINLNDAPPVWRSTQSMHFARRQLNAVLLPDGKVLVTGGTGGPGFNNPDTPVYQAEIWDPVSEAWTVMASASVKRLYHSATVLLPDGKVLSTGGNDVLDTEIYSPPYLFNATAPRPTITSAPATVGYGNSFFVGTPDAAAITTVRMIRLSSTTHAFNMGQHVAELNFSPASGGINATTPGNGNLAPPGYYLLFIVKAAGVPSIGKIVQLTSSAPPPPPPPPPPSGSTTINQVSPANVTASAGSSFNLTYNWNATPISPEHRVFVHFVNSAGAIAIGDDHAPPTPTTQWSGAVTYTRSISVPSTLPAGTYQILAGLFNPATGVRATLTPGSGVTDAGSMRYQVGTLSVGTTPPPPPPPPPSFNLTVSTSGRGSVSSSPAGINCGSDCSEAYSPNTVVTLTATPNKATFVGWSGACGGTNRVCTVTMNASKSVSAQFSKR